MKANAAFDKSTRNTEHQRPAAKRPGPDMVARGHIDRPADGSVTVPTHQLLTTRPGSEEAGQTQGVWMHPGNARLSLSPSATCSTAASLPGRAFFDGAWRPSASLTSIAPAATRRFRVSPYCLSTPISGSVR